MPPHDCCLHCRDIRNVGLTLGHFAVPSNWPGSAALRSAAPKVDIADRKG